MYVVIGLGNPGKKYFKTRHNAGSRIIDFLRTKYPVIARLKRKTYLAWKIELNGYETYILQTSVFMNESGIAVRNILQDFHIRPEEMLVIYDDVYLPFEKIRIRRKGSSGGHNGINSIIEELKTGNFPRVKIGIGNENVQDLVDYVLSDFTEKEESHINAICDTVSLAIENIIKYGIDKAMAKYNG
ncbi:MAG: aminoacyl-tRNA hydrolase [Candidatus Omnitrophica bacterium]|nr:aminoacyl-tRNA hydrolase [Candidatus Omnitrophota bacterium]